MKWSKVEKSAEDLLADTLKGRIRFHVTKYCRGTSYTMSRGWITYDGKELKNFSQVKWLMASGELVRQIESLNTGKEGTKAHPARHGREKWDQAEALLEQKEVFSKDQFYLSLQQYIQLSIDAALNSSNTIIRAIALLDRRCGKRRLATLKPPDDAPNLVKECYRIRCEAEGFHPTT